jgi:hypothetical protein
MLCDALCAVHIQVLEGTLIQQLQAQAQILAANAQAMVSAAAAEPVSGIDGAIKEQECILR